MKRIAAIFTAALLTATPALALDVPSPSSSDSRVAFLGFLAFMQWPSEEEAPTEEVVESTRRISSGGEFQPADIVEPQPEPAAPAAAPADEQPVGPIERIRIEQAEIPAEPTEAELLFESSKRAPLMAYQGNRTATPQAGAPCRTPCPTSARPRSAPCR